MKYSLRLSLAVTLVALLVPTAAFAIAQPKILFTPVNASLEPGQSVSATLSMGQPIICPTGTNPCEVSLDFSASQTQGVSITPATVVWDTTQWAETRSVVISLDAAANVTSSQIVTLSAVAQSGSFYYNAFQTTFPVTLVVPAPAPAPEQLAVTGQDVSPMVMLAGGLTIAGTVFMAVGLMSRRRQRG